MASQVLARQRFLLAALEQGKCAVTGARGRAWHWHHVLYEKHLVRIGLPVYDPRNVLRVTINAHAGHHGGGRRIRTVELLDVNIAYISAAIGPARAVAYLRRYYDDVTIPDVRLARLGR